jgi:hypothetical protein
MSSGKPEVPSSTERNIENRIMELEAETSRLQRLVAELLLRNQELRDGHSAVSKSDTLFNREIDLCRSW